MERKIDVRKEKETGKVEIEVVPEWDQDRKNGSGWKINTP